MNHDEFFRFFRIDQAPEFLHSNRRKTLKIKYVNYFSLPEILKGLIGFFGKPSVIVPTSRVDVRTNLNK